MRLFLAIELPAQLKAAVGAFQQELKRRLERNAERGSRVGWVQPDLMHLTLKFLGETDEQVVDQLKADLDESLLGQRRVALPLTRLGVFPRAMQPRVLWIGPAESWEQGAEAAELASLHRLVEARCEALGFEWETRPFAPHLTLARVKEGERSIGQALLRSGVLDHPLSLGILPVDGVVLMKSDLRPGGPVYTRLWDVRLPTTGAGDDSQAGEV
ncbi:MAG: RNA 2',3'-cyclic phosphodiesterase [Nitrospiraceae bacterium]|nr:RNA 2',3'-cyclic phosphodiesterase [Nitrospiraceae bacterium]